MIRAWSAQPDHVLETDAGPVAAVSQDAILKLCVDAAIVVSRIGGSFALQVVRAKTGVPDEMVTTAAMVQFRDRTTDARAQPEQRVPPAMAEDFDVPAAAPEPREGDTLEVEGHPVAVGPGGEFVDESDLPPHMRGQ